MDELQREYEQWLSSNPKIDVAPLQAEYDAWLQSNPAQPAPAQPAPVQSAPVQTAPVQTSTVKKPGVAKTAEQAQKTTPAQQTTESTVRKPGRARKSDQSASQSEQSDIMNRERKYVPGGKTTGRIRTPRGWEAPEIPVLEPIDTTIGDGANQYDLSSYLAKMGDSNNTFTEEDTERGLAEYAQKGREYENAARHEIRRQQWLNDGTYRHVDDGTDKSEKPKDTLVMTNDGSYEWMSSDEAYAKQQGTGNAFITGAANRIISPSKSVNTMLSNDARKNADKNTDISSLLEGYTGDNEETIEVSLPDVDYSAGQAPLSDIEAQMSEEQRGTPITRTVAAANADQRLKNYESGNLSNDELRDLRNLYYTFEDYYYGQSSPSEHDRYQMQRLRNLMLQNDDLFSANQRFDDYSAMNDAASAAHPIATKAGDLTAMAAEYYLFNQLGEASGLTEGITNGLNKAGVGKALGKAGEFLQSFEPTSKIVQSGINFLKSPGAAEYAADLGVNQLGDLFVQDIPRLMEDLSSGMGAAQAARNLAANEGENFMYNVGIDAAGRSLKWLKNNLSDAVSAIRNSADPISAARQYGDEIYDAAKQTIGDNAVVPTVKDSVDQDISAFFRDHPLPKNDDEWEVLMKDMDNAVSKYADDPSSMQYAQQEMVNMIGQYGEQERQIAQAIKDGDMDVIREQIDNDILTLQKMRPQTEEDWIEYYAQADRLNNKYKGTAGEELIYSDTFYDAENAAYRAMRDTQDVVDWLPDQEYKGLKLEFESMGDVLSQKEKAMLEAAPDNEKFFKELKTAREQLENYEKSVFTYDGNGYDIARDFVNTERRMNTQLKKAGVPEIETWGKGVTQPDYAAWSMDEFAEKYMPKNTALPVGEDGFVDVAKALEGVEDNLPEMREIAPGRVITDADRLEGARMNYGNSKRRLQLSTERLKKAWDEGLYGHRRGGSGGTLYDIAKKQEERRLGRTLTDDEFLAPYRAMWQEDVDLVENARAAARMSDQGATLRATPEQVRRAIDHSAMDDLGDVIYKTDNNGTIQSFESFKDAARRVSDQQGGATADSLIGDANNLKAWMNQNVLDASAVDDITSDALRRAGWNEDEIADALSTGAKSTVYEDVAKTASDANSPSFNKLLSDDDLDEYMLSGSSDGVKKRLREVRDGKKVAASDRDSLKQFVFGDADDFANTVSYGRVGSDLAEKVAEKSSGKIDVSKDFLELDKGHGTHAAHHLKVTQKGNLPMSEDEFIDALLRTNEADVISATVKKNGEKNIKLALNADDGKIVMVELESKNTGGLKLKTMWKMDDAAFDDWFKKNNPSSLLNLEDSVIPKGNKRDAVVLDDNSLSQLSDSVNPSARNAESMIDQLQPTAPRTIPEVEAPRSDIDVPDGMRERSYARNVREQNVEGVADEVAQSFEDQPELYRQLKNATTAQNADDIMNQGMDYARNQFDALLAKHDPVSVPLGQKIAHQLSQQGDNDAAAEVLRRISRELTNAGQFTQAAAITMMKDDPMTALQYAMKEIDSLNEAGAKRFGKKWTDFSLTDAEKALFDNIEPGDAKAIGEAFDQIGARIGKEYPVTMMDKILEGRKVAMLLNVRTNVRNVGANVPTYFMRSVSDRVEALGQHTYKLVNPELEITQSVLPPGREAKNLAHQVYDGDTVKALMDSTGGKYEINELKNIVGDNLQTFKGNNPVENFLDFASRGKYKKMLSEVNEKAFGKQGVESGIETLRNLTYKLLDVGDTPFVRANFENRLASYIQARGIKNIAEVPEEAIQMAWEEAMKATYKDNSWAVQMLTGIRNNGIGKIPVIGRPLSQAAIPFLQAPGNIAARMVDYSPIRGTKGIADIIKGAKQGSQDAVRKGIEEAAKGLTGTGMVLLGMKLYESGLLTGGTSSDKDQRQFEKQNGYKPYALHIGNHYFTYDWAQPAAMPLMVGTMLADAINESDQYDSDILRYFGVEDSTAGKVIGGVKSGAGEVVNAWFDESPLQGLQELMGGGYGGTDIAKNILDVGVNNFLQSFVPSTFGAVAKSVDPVQRNTTDPSNEFATQMNILQAKMPGMSDKLPAKYDTWGREVRRANTAAGAWASNFVIPGEYSYDKGTEIDNEINRLFESTGNNAVFPQVAPNSITIDGESRKLNNEEVSNYQREMGQTSYNLAESFVNSQAYQGMDDETRAETTAKLYSFSKQLTERDLFGKEPSTNKAYFETYDKDGADAVVNLIAGKQVANAAGYASNSKAGEAIAEAAASGDIAQVEELQQGFAAFEDAGLAAWTYDAYKTAQQKIPDLTTDEYISAFKRADSLGEAGKGKNNGGISQNEIIALMNSDKRNAERYITMFWSSDKTIPYLGDDGNWHKKSKK